MHAELFYTPPLPAGGEPTDYCGLFCLWHDDAAEQVRCLRAFTVLGLARQPFLALVERLSRLEEMPVPPELLRTLWEWYDANRQISYQRGNAVRHLTIHVESRN